MGISVDAIGGIWVGSMGIGVDAMGISVDAIGGIWVGGMGIGDWCSNSLYLSILDSNRSDGVDNWDTSTISKTMSQTTISINSMCGRIAVSSIKESWVSLSISLSLRGSISSSK